jgi:glycerol-3-phosphate dehydrogenase
MPARDEDLETELELPDGAREQLGFRYGHAARKVLDVAEGDPDLARPILPGHPDLLAEAVIAARSEQARSAADVLLRRTRLGLVAASELREDAPVRAVAEAMAPELGWSKKRVGEEVERWREVVAAEGLDPAASLG